MSSNPSPRILWASFRECSESDCACPDADGTWPELRWAKRVDMSEQDCACPDTGLSSSLPPIPQAALWRRPSGLYRTALPDQHEIAFAPTPTTHIAVLNAPASRILDAFAVPCPPRRVAEALPDLAPSDVVHTALQLARGGLLQSAQETPNPCFTPSHTLAAWIHVTDACNLRCSYCYVRKSGERMDEETGCAAVDGVFRSALAGGFRAVKLKYAGGEPTLNWSLVRSLHRRAHLLADRHDLELREVVLSNGALLDDEMIDWLRSEGVRLMISLDGVGETHDAQRPFADGHGSFAQIAHNIDRALTHGLRPHLSITVTARNVDGLSDVVVFALERDLLFNLNFVRQPGVEYCDDYIIAGVKAAFAVIEDRLPRRSLIGGLVDRSIFSAPHEHACGAGHNYLVIDSQGRVSRCQMTMGRPVTDVWTDDPLQAARSQCDGFQNVSVDEKEGCRDCVWRYWCAGGCPLLAHRAAGRSDAPSPYCDVYKSLYPDLLRLEGLRLLKWQPSPP